ncbi:HAD-IB family phosphatase [Woodsholea maritima]|uniref:HAD-IB family phosphatase n=1 Tax=Woodsholea maritima TaxID=240237 RepID=UPI0003731CB9|nr:HAD-IB family phosphatase [Woodsholea maritima]
MSRLIVFDVDSTLLSVESLDFAVELSLKDCADGAERTQKLTEITNRGMAGEMDFRSSLEARLALAGLTRSHISTAAEALKAHITPGMDALIAKLRKKKWDVYAVSGGFSDLFAPALEELNFAAGELRGNKFVYEADTVSGFDRQNPLSENGGKAHVIDSLKRLTGCDRAIMIGDGITDYEAFAQGAADAFIGFGGVVRRAAVADKAPAFANSVDDLTRLLVL